MLLATEFSDKELQEDDQAIIESQLRVEEELDWRKNFLAGNGTAISPQLVNETARVKNQEPVILESDDKDQQKVYDKVSKKYKKARKQVDKEKKKLQKKNKARIRDDGLYNDYQIIQANQLSSNEYYELLAETAHQIDYVLIDQSKSKKVRDTYRLMYKNLHYGCELDASYKNQIRTYELLLEDKEVMEDEALLEETKRRLAVLRERQPLAHKWMEDVHAAITLSLTNKMYVNELTDREKEVASLWRYWGADYKKRTENSADVAVDEQLKYIKSTQLNQQELEEKTNKENETTEGKQEIEQWVCSYYDDVNALDVEKYAAMGNRELMRHMRELQEVGSIAEWMRKLGYRELAEQPRGVQYPLTIIDEYIRGREDGSLLAERLTLAKYCAKTARFMWYREALELERLKPGDIIPEDRWFDAQQTLSPAELMEGLKKECTSARIMVDSYLDRLNSRKAHMQHGWSDPEGQWPL